MVGWIFKKIRPLGAPTICIVLSEYDDEWVVCSATGNDVSALSEENGII